MIGDPRFGHLARLTTATGLYEHARGTEPRPEHGMCVDDVARALVVTAREPDPHPDVVALSRVYLGFLTDAVKADGLLHNRRDLAGVWLDAPSSEDHWGRAVWAFGTAAAHSPDRLVVAGARRSAARALQARSPHLRSTAYAALGAVQLARSAPDDLAARRMLRDASTALHAVPATAEGPGMPRPWPWPQPRLTYANAVLPEAMIAVGRALRDGPLLRRGLLLLAWLEDEQTVDDHLSVVPAGGRSPGPHEPAFDQQPIEVAALAEAARTAFAATGDVRWTRLLTRCLAWFAGDNDAHLPMCDPATGGGMDGLEDGSVNQNQGAESTLAWLATSQLAPAPAWARAPA